MNAEQATAHKITTLTTEPPFVPALAQVLAQLHDAVLQVIQPYWDSVRKQWKSNVRQLFGRKYNNPRHVISHFPFETMSDFMRHRQPDAWPVERQLFRAIVVTAIDPCILPTLQRAAQNIASIAFDTINYRRRHHGYMKGGDLTYVRHMVELAGNIVQRHVANPWNWTQAQFPCASREARTASRIVSFLEAWDQGEPLEFPLEDFLSLQRCVGKVEPLPVQLEKGRVPSQSPRPPSNQAVRNRWQRMQRKQRRKAAKVARNGEAFDADYSYRFQCDDHHLHYYYFDYNYYLPALCWHHQASTNMTDALEVPVWTTCLSQNVHTSVDTIANAEEKQTEQENKSATRTLKQSPP